MSVPEQGDHPVLDSQSWGAGPALVCLHGGLGVDSAYLKVPAIIGLAKSRRVITFDQRGHGRSARSGRETYTHDRWAADVKDLAAHHRLGRFSLLGHSYGGFLALEFAVRHQGLLNALVLVGTSAGPVQSEPPPVADDDALRQLFRDWWPHFFPGPEKFWDVFERITFSSDPFEAAFRNELPRYDLRDRVRDLAVPTLLVVGSEDHYRPHMEWLFENLPNGELVVVQNAGHLPFLDAPDRFRTAVDDFLTR